MNSNLRLLRRTGVSLSSITIGGDIMQVIDTLSCGDRLVVLLVSELSPQITRQQMLLKRIADNGVIFRPLNKIDTTPVLASENFMDRLLRNLGIKPTGTNHKAAKTESQPNTELRTKIINNCLKSYYGLMENVETICDKADIHPRALYDFLRRHNLPSRREMKAQPRITPCVNRGSPRTCWGHDPWKKGGKTQI